MDILKIDGTALPTPHEYQVTLSQLGSEGTARPEAGDHQPAPVRGGVAKIAVHWYTLSTGECAAILNATAPDSFSVEYFFGSPRTATMYAGDRTAALRAAREGQAVWEITMNLVEY